MLKAFVYLLTITFSATAWTAEKNKILELLNSPRYLGYGTLSEASSFTYREMSLVIHDDAIEVLIADKQSSSRILLPFSEATLTQVTYPYNHPTSPIKLQSIRWPPKLLILEGTQTQVSLALDFKQEDLRREEAARFPPGFMPPIHGVYIRDENNTNTDFIRRINGAFYSDDEVIRGDLDKARTMMKAGNVQLMPLSMPPVILVSCSQAFSN